MITEYETKVGPAYARPTELMGGYGLQGSSAAQDAPPRDSCSPIQAAEIELDAAIDSLYQRVDQLERALDRLLPPDKAAPAAPQLVNEDARDYRSTLSVDIQNRARAVRFASARLGAILERLEL